MNFLRRLFCSHVWLYLDSEREAFHGRLCRKCGKQRP